MSYKLVYAWPVRSVSRRRELGHEHGSGSVLYFRNLTRFKNGLLH